MRMTAGEARARFAGARVARLATITPDGRPHVVPIVFALDAHRLYFAVDAKPKSTTALQRLANLASDPHVSVLVDRYADDWTQLWWARADGQGRVIDDAGPVVTLLATKYSQYAEQPPAGPYVEITVTRWSGWRASG